jgi:hypothetical protein
VIWALERFMPSGPKSIESLMAGFLASGKG